MSEDRLIHTNHLIGELAGLIIASIVFDFENKNKLLSKCLAKLSRELKNQVFDDGISKEQSSNDHRFVLDFLTLIVVLANKAKIDIPKNILTAIYDSLEKRPLNSFFPFKDSGHYVVRNMEKGFYFFVRGGKYGMGGNYFFITLSC